MKRIDAYYEDIIIRIEIEGNNCIMSAGKEITTFTNNFNAIVKKLVENKVKFKLTEF